MKRIVAVVCLVAALTVTAFAKAVDYAACTADHVTAVLSVTLKDEILKTVPQMERQVGEAFARAASQLTAEALVGPEGYQTFLRELTEETNAAIEDIAGPPAIVYRACP